MTGGRSNLYLFIQLHTRFNDNLSNPVDPCLCSVQITAINGVANGWENTFVVARPRLGGE